MKLRKWISVALVLLIIATAIPVENLLVAKAAVEPATGTIKAGDTTYVRRNRYKDNGDTLGGIKAGDLRWDRGSLYEYKAGLTTPISNSDGEGYESKQYRWPYVALKVSAPKEGIYNLSVVISTNNNPQYSTIGMVVNGVMNVLPFTKNKNDTINTTALLKQGENIIVFTSPMPASISKRATGTSDSNVYPWNDFISFTFAEGLTVQGAPTGEEVVASINGVTRVEAEDTAYSIWNGYNKTEGQKDASGTDSAKNVVGGASKSACTHTSTQLASYLDDYKTAYVQYQVEAPKDGNYNIRLGGYVGSDKKLNHDRTTVMANDSVYEATFNGFSELGAATLNVNLKKGYNIIRCFAPIANEESAGWLNQDFLELDSRLTAVTQSQTTIYAGDEAKVLANQYTDKGNTLEDAVQELIQEDKPSVETVEYAKERIERWPWAAMKVTAPKDGYYDITVNLGTKSGASSTQIAMIIDGKAVSQPYAKAGSAAVDCSVYLTAGTHQLVFTLPMPKTSAEAASSDVWNMYPWCNYNSFVLDSRLSIEKIPTLDEVKEHLGVMVKAGDETKVLANNFKNEGDTLGGASTGDLRWDALTLDIITVDDLRYMPYAAIKVNAEADGNYDILAEIGANKDAMADQLGLMVDGTSVYSLEFKKIDNSVAKTTIYLTEGEHILVFTSPMPETVEEFEIYAKENNLTNGNAMTHPWMNFKTLAFAKGITVNTAPTIAEVEYPHYDRIEAEDTKYVLYTGYSSEAEKSKSASGGAVSGGTKRWLLEQSFEELSQWIDGSKEHIAYVEYAVIAPADGTYAIRPGIVADINKSVEKRNEIKKPFIAVIANNSVYKAQFTADWGETQAIKVNVDLKKGLNIIRCTTYTTDQEIYKVSSWINQDYLDLDKRLKPVERTTSVVEAENSKYYQLLEVQDGSKQEQASKGKVLGSADILRAKSVNMTIEKLTADQIRMVPYHSYTVEAPMDGYYSMSINMVGDGRLSKSQIAMFVDGKVNMVKYNRAGKTTADCRAIITVYLTKGEHVLTFTTPLPANANELANTEWSHRWMNFDYLTLHDGLKLAAKQKEPTDIPDLVRIETEDVGLPNMTKINQAAEGKETREGYVGGAKYRRSQNVADIKANGIDERKTPFVQYMVNANQSGTYTVYFQSSYGIYKPTVEKMDGTFAIEVNGEVSFHTVELIKDKTNTSLIPVTMKLTEGNNIVRITHLTADSVKGEGYGWADFNYIEISAADSKKITFLATNGVVEAERAEAVSYVSTSDAGASNGQKVGSGDYSYVDEKDITFENLDVKKPGELSRVTYTVVAEQAGTYYISVQFIGGVKNYTYQELVDKGEIGFAVSVNESEKQLVEFCPDASSSNMSRIVEVNLKQGENKIMVTTTLADYISGVSPRIEDEYRLYWMDHDAIRLTAGVSDANANVEPYDIDDTDIDHKQLEPNKSANSDANKVPIELIAIGLASIALLIVLFILIILAKKKKKNR